MILKVIRLCRFFFAPVFLFLLVSQAYSGTLDPTFGTRGKVTVDFPYANTYSSSGNYIFVQPSGRIVALGSHSQSGPDGNVPGVVTVGLTSSGAIDTTFFSGSGKNLDWSPNSFINLTDAQMLADGRFMRLGQFVQIPATFSARLYRIGVNGSTENFLPNLHVNDSQPQPGKFTVQSDGKTLAVVNTGASSMRYAYLVRFNSDGSRDAAFGTNGVKEIPRISPLQEGRIVGIKTLPNGKILIAGQQNNFKELFLLRLDSDGNADHSFGRLGLVRHNFGEQTFVISDLIVQPDNKYLVSGSISTPDNDALMIRFTQRGRLDYGFGDAGVVITDFTPDGNDSFNGAKLTADGKIIAVGQASISPSTVSNFLVAKHSASGGLEANTQTSFTTSQNSSASNAVIQSDGKIVVIGYTRNPNSSINGNVFAIARYTDITND